MVILKQVSLFLVLISLLGGCADKQLTQLGPQFWQGIDFVIETRPTRIQAGMNEVIVIASREKYKPGVGLVVSIRVDEKLDWRQAIQDGYTGVYRRAILVSDPEQDVLAVHVRNIRAEQGEEKETILYFPLKPAAR